MLISSLDSSLAKVYGSNIVVENSMDAIQIYGGPGYMRDIRIEKLLRDVRLLQIYEGINEINLLTVIENYIRNIGDAR
ncbi:hypothetical protein DRN84_01485 [Candidatus Geothermarchaeota archaeon]|nr:MAG: hypothetical protein DRN87_01765 [Candidatus Geothermarchaeota archaeon]RLG62607.1 MAG: hypothetical protein DRN84_01485 [Candidatus Geothermarchaeota archaeon]HEW94303.1 hypothetical protein [Thermoprotei archaeon]